MCHERAVTAEPAKSEGDKMFRIVDDGTGRHKEMAVVCHSVFHEGAVLEMSIERLLFFQFAIIEPYHIQLVADMLKDDLAPSAGQAVEMIALLRLGGIVEWPFQPTVFGAAVAPFVTTAFIAVFIEESNSISREGIFVVLIAVNLLHKVSVDILVVA